MTTGPKPRIAIAGFQHETNVYAPVRTSFADFLDGGGWPGLTAGDQVVDIFRGLNIPIGGFIDAALEEAELLPILWTSAEPASVVSADAFDRISDQILSAVRQAGQIDGVYLDLHGAMVTETSEDGEGALLRRIRDHFGRDLQIAVSLDLHANITAEMVDLSDVITIYRTYPHLDMDATGARAWSLLRDMIRTGTCPAKAFRRASQQIPLSAQCTEFGPLQTLYRGLEALPNGVSGDIALGFPLSGVPGFTPSLVVYAMDAVSADLLADRLLAGLESAIATVENPLLSPEDAVSRALSLSNEGETIVLADVQDNSGAGAMSDTTGLLKALVDAGAKDAVLGTLWDPVVAARAHEGGVGARIQVSLGGRHGPAGVEPLPCEVEVLALTDGVFTCRGAMQRDVETDIGPCALLKIVASESDVSVIISSRRHQVIDQEAFRHIGVDPASRRIVAVKSTVHFRADFAPIASRVLSVMAPGYSDCTPVTGKRSGSQSTRTDTH